MPVVIPERDEDDDDDDEEEKGREEGGTTTTAAAATKATKTTTAEELLLLLPRPALRHARIDLADEEGADLLSHLPFATAWVREALTATKGGGRGEGSSNEEEEEEGEERGPKSENKVLIHCSAGVSRSAAVAAACLMVLREPPPSLAPSSSPPRLSADAAVAAVAAAAPGTAPNPGFLRQLRLFSEMGLRLDARSSAEYRAWRAMAMAAAAAAGGRAARTEAAHAANARNAAPPPKGRQQRRRRPPHPPLTTYRCRACRRLVATSDNAVPATSETGGGPQKMFAGKSWNKAKIIRNQGGGAAAPAKEKEEEEEEEGEEGKEGKEGKEEAASPPPPPLPLGSDCSSLFVEPLKWMLDALSLESGGGGGGGGGAGGGGGGGGGGSCSGKKDKDGCEASEKSPPPTRGKLHCPGCSARLGSFSWAGSQSAAGAWVVPAFQLHLCRLDAAEEEEEGEAEKEEKGGKDAPPGPPAIPPSVASRIRQPRFLK